MAAKTPLHKLNVPDQSSPCVHSVAAVQKAECCPVWAAEQGVKLEKEAWNSVSHHVCSLFQKTGSCLWGC